MPYTPNVDPYSTVGWTAPQSNGGDNFQTYTTLTTTAAVAARPAVAGSRTLVTDLTATNTSATATRVDILDGATVLWSANLQPGTSIHKTFGTRLIGTVGTALNLQLSAAVTDVRVSLQGNTTY